MMKRNFLWNIAYGLILVLLLIGEALTVATLVRLDMLPVPYLAAIAAVFGLFALLVGYLFFSRSKRSGKGKRIIACVLTVLLVCGCAVITTVAFDVMETLAATSEEPEEPAITREVYVLKNTEGDELIDLYGYTIGYVKNFDEDCTNQVFDAIKKKTKEDVISAGYTNMFTMVDALLAGKIDAMVLNGGYMSILEEDDAYLDFSEKVRILAQVEVVESGDPMSDLWNPGAEEPTDPVETESTEPEETTEATEAEEDEEDFTTLKPFVVYISGSDTRSKTLNNKTRSDVNILAAVNPMTKQVVLINTPRDYYVSTAASSSGAKDKLTHCGIYGIECSMKTLGKLYDQKVKYYVKINFTGFEKVIDAIGGVTVKSEHAFTLYQNVGKIKVGSNKLNGKQALAFARTRKGLAGGDNQRGKHQMEVIRAVIKKATSGTTVIKNYNKIIKSIDGMFTMSIPTKTINKMMKMQLSDMAQWNVVTYSATGTNTQAICYSMPSMKLSVVQPNSSSVKKATLLMDMVMSGEILTEEVVDGITG